MKATVIHLSDSTRELFAKMRFPEIPKEAKYVAFGENDEVAFLSELSTPGQLISIPKMTTIFYQDVEDLQLEEI